MATSGGRSAPRRLLVCRVGAKLCGLPLSAVIETCRPLPTEPLSGTPPFVLGLALLRARPTLVLDAHRLLDSGSGTPPTRYVSLRVGDTARRVALAVDAVVGVRDVAESELEPLPDLLSNDGDARSTLGSLDQRLLVVLESARLVPDTLWQQLEQERASA
jgi:purine-binding chemotaxis protein CheW